MPDGLIEHFPVFQSIFGEYKEIIAFQKTFDKDIRANIVSASATLETLTKHTTEMKIRYSNYARQMEKCLGLVTDNREYFNQIRKLTKSGLMINDELSRPTRGVPNMKLYFTDFIKCAKKDGKDMDAAVYNEMLSVLDNVGKTIDDALLLQNIEDLPDSFQIDEQGCCVKSGAVDLIKIHKGFFRKLLGMKASNKNKSGYLFLFEKCLIICMKIDSKGGKIKRFNMRENFQLEAFIHISDLIEFSEEDNGYVCQINYDGKETLKVLEKQTNIVHLINLDSEDLAAEWSETIVAEVDKFNQMVQDLKTE